VEVAVSTHEDNDPYLFEDDGERYVLGASLNYVFWIGDLGWTC